jgi:hypothetical protein
LDHCLPFHLIFFSSWTAEKLCKKKAALRIIMIMPIQKIRNPGFGALGVPNFS